MPNLNDKAPEFSLLDTGRELVSLGDFKGKQLVIAFFPAAFTGVCEKELCTFRDSLASLNDLNASVVAISVDGVFANKAFAEKNALTFPVLSDFQRKTTAAYGVELADFAGMKGYTAAQRSVFVVDGDGIVRYAWIADNPGIEPNYDEVKAALK